MERSLNIKQHLTVLKQGDRNLFLCESSHFSYPWWDLFYLSAQNPQKVSFFNMTSFNKRLVLLRADGHLIVGELHRAAMRVVGGSHQKAVTAAISRPRLLLDTVEQTDVKRLQIWCHHHVHSRSVCLPRRLLRIQITSFPSAAVSGAPRVKLKDAPPSLWQIRTGSSAALSTQAWKACLFTLLLFANNRCL